MVFNIVMIVILVIQGGLICWLAVYADSLNKAVISAFAYFQRMAMDLGYPQLLSMDDDNDELKNWSERRK